MSPSAVPAPPICAVTVTFHPDPKWPERFAAQAAEAAGAVIVDNGSEGEAEMVAAAASRHGAHLIRNAENLGLAAALNQGARWAFGQGHRWALLFDQDTEPAPGMGAELLKLYGLAAATGPTAIVGTNFFDPARNAPRFQPPVAGTDEWVVARTVVASGSLLERDAYEAVGPFREEFFVDSVDHDYCLRSRARGFLVARSTRPLMRHGLGASTTHAFLGARVTTTNHLAARRHDMARNRVVLAKEYLFREPVWVLASLLALVRETAAIVAFERDGGRKASAVVAGAWHGLTRRLEPRPAGEAS